MLRRPDCTAVRCLAVIEPRFVAVLHRIHSRLDRSGIEWAITGSLGMALQGVDVDVHDIDLQTDKAGAYWIAQHFSESVVRPVVYSASERIRSHFGALEIDGVTVEIMGDVQKRLKTGEWEEPVQVRRHMLWVEREGMSLPVLSLEYEYQAYLQMGRVEKARLLQGWLQRSGHRPPAANAHSH